MPLAKINHASDTIESPYDIAPYQDLSLPDGSLNVASFVSLTTVNGPENRCGLWLQGCRKRCPGCMNHKMLEEKNEEIIPSKTMVQMITRAVNSVAKISGITIAGGEPTLQATNLAQIIQQVRQELCDKNFSVLLFSGYRYETLIEHAKNYQGLQHLLKLTDTLVDGTYERDKKDQERLAGSTNQRIIHLQPTLSSWDLRRPGTENIIKQKNGHVNLIQVGIPKEARNQYFYITK